MPSGVDRSPALNSDIAPGWGASTEKLSGDVWRSRVVADGRAMDYGEVVDALCRDAAFRDFFNALLAALPVEAWFWETPPVTVAGLARPFEFVQVASPALAGVSADPSPFAGVFEHAGNDCGVVGFDNLGGDARLVAPCPCASAGTGAYAHIGAFVRGAPDDQCQRLWQTIGETLAQRVNETPLWLSTSGLGVYWVHVRFDSRPKYYTHMPYRRDWNSC